MDINKLIELLQEGEKLEPMTPRTLRLSSKVDKEIRVFCKANNIRFARLIRVLVEEGWKRAKDA
jgi:hypothetical protein